MRKPLLSVFLLLVMVSALAFVGSFHFCTAQSSIPTPIPTLFATGGNGNLELTMNINKSSYSLAESVNLTFEPHQR